MTKLPEALSDFSRRDFLIVSALIFPALFGGFGSQWALQVPGSKQEEIISYPQPGWLETRNPTRPQFIEHREGHKEYLKFMCKNDPLLKGILRIAFQEFFSSEKVENPHPLLGDAFAEHLEYARNGLKSQSAYLLSNEPSLENILHVAFFTFAAVYSPYFSQRELKEDFGVSVDLVESDDQIWWLEGAKDKVPTVFPADSSFCGSEADLLFRCEGVDRTTHFAEHAFLAHEYFYSLNNQLQDAGRIPNAARKFADLGRSREQKVKLLSFLGGNMWELKETLGYDRTYDDQGNLIHTGYFDNLVQLDLRANALGANFAVLLTKPGLTEKELAKSLEAGVDFLNWRELNRREWNGIDMPGDLLPIQPFRLKSILRD